ncbi:MAG: PAS domain S-box protein [bacterium]|nr:PAS domain S-box protein [bacterium]
MKEIHIQTLKQSAPGKIILPVFITIILFVLTIFLLILPSIDESMMKNKREMIRNLTESAWYTLKSFHDREKSGEISAERARELAKDHINGLRYGPELKDYFWIITNDMIKIANPYSSDLVGKDLSTYTDPEGKRVFAEVAEVVQRDGEGYVDYMWQWKNDPSRIVPKISYVKGFAPWGWIVGTGIYIEDVQLEIASMRKKITFISLGILIVIFLLSLYIILQGAGFKSKEQQAEKALQVSEDKYKTLFQISPSFSMLINTEGNVIEMNSIGSERYGYSITGDGIHFHEFVHEDYIEKATSIFAHLYIQGNDLKKSFDQQRIEHDKEYRVECYKQLVQIGIKDEQFRIWNSKRTRVFDTLLWANLMVDKENLGIKGTLTTSIDITERNLLESKLRSILELIGEGYYEVDLKGSLTFFSDALCNILGYTRSELPGMNFEQFSSKKSFQKIVSVFKKVHDSKESVTSVNWEVFRKDNEKRYVEASFSLLTDHAGTGVGFSGIIRDVTERRDAENALMQSEEKYREVFKALPIFAMLIDLDMRIVECNEKFINILGYPSQDTDLSTIDLVHKNDHDRGVEIFVRIYNLATQVKTRWREKLITKDECYRELRSLSIREEELRIVDKDGKAYYISFNGTLWINRETLAIKGILATAIDLSEKKDLELKLIESERKYREIVEEKTKDIIISVDSNMRFLTANKNLRMKLGYFEKDIVGREILEIIYDDPFDKDRINRTTFLDHIRMVLKEGLSDVRFKAVCVHRTLGEPVTLQFKLDPIYTGDSITGFIGFASEPSDDPLREFLEDVKVIYKIDNHLTTADEICFRLTRDLAKYFKRQDVDMLRIGLREMVVNAIEHGNLNITFEEKSEAQANEGFINLLSERQADPVNRHKRVYLHCSINANRVIYTVRDEGTGFNYKKIMNQDIDDLNQGFLQHGRGVITAKGIFDKVKYNRKGNEVELIKYAKGK